MEVHGAGLWDSLWDDSLGRATLSSFVFHSLQLSEHLVFSRLRLARCLVLFFTLVLDFHVRNKLFVRFEAGFAHGFGYFDFVFAIFLHLLKPLCLNLFLNFSQLQ